MLCGEMIFIKSFNFQKKKFHFNSLHLIFPCYYCSINLKRQSQHSGLRPDTSSLVDFRNNLVGIIHLVKGKITKPNYSVEHFQAHLLISVKFYQQINIKNYIKL